EFAMLPLGRRRLECAMRNEHFDVPVTVESDRRGRVRAGPDTGQAAGIPVGRWARGGPGSQNPAPPEGGLAGGGARRAVASARKAFIAAAKEARVFVREGR